MIDVELAMQLKQAGLEWHPTKRDNFMIPHGELAQEVFTLNDQSIFVQSVRGEYTVMFHGSAEWALDHVLVTDVIWLPSESQLREAIQNRIEGPAPSLTLHWDATGYHCQLVNLGDEHTFDGGTAEEAYGHALFFLLRRDELAKGRWVQSA